MPFFRIAEKLVYFAHVPKCAGISVNLYIARHYGPPAFLDRLFMKQPEPERWSKSSPQHVPAATLARYIPLSIFDEMFTVVRHPADRIASAFMFQRDLERLVEPETSFSDWLASLPERMRADPFAFDNHTRPMSDIVPEGARVFRLEDGLNRVADWLASLTGTPPDERGIDTENSREQRLEKMKSRGAPVCISASDRVLIAELYAPDFERFGYDSAAETLYSS